MEACFYSRKGQTFFDKYTQAGVARTLLCGKNKP